MAFADLLVMRAMTGMGLSRDACGGLVRWMSAVKREGVGKMIGRHAGLGLMSARLACSDG